MKKPIKISRIFNISLAVFYIPLSLLCWFMQMINETTIDMKPSLYTKLIDISSTIFAIIPILCLVCIILSRTLRNKGHIKLSFLLQFSPLAVTLANIISVIIANSLYL